MRFHVGPHRYQLRIELAAIFLREKERQAVISEDDRTITISPKCSAQNRLWLLAHELTHAWVFASGEPSSLEDWCDLAATMAISLLRDLAATGGEEAIQRLLPGEGPQPGAARVMLTRNRECGKCRTTIGGLSVVCTASVTPGILDLSLHCEGCGHIQRWQETASPSGHPSGMAVGQARFERGEIVAEFLSQYPESAAV